MVKKTHSFLSRTPLKSLPIIVVSIVALAIVVTTMFLSQHQQQIEQDAAALPSSLGILPTNYTPDTCGTNGSAYLCSPTLINTTTYTISWQVLTDGTLPGVAITPMSGTLPVNNQAAITISIPKTDCSRGGLTTSKFTFNVTGGPSQGVQTTVATFSCQNPLSSPPPTQPYLSSSTDTLSPSDCGFSLDTGIYVCTTTLLVKDNPGNQSISWTGSTSGLTGMGISPSNGVVYNIPEKIQLTIPKADCSGLNGQVPVGTFTFTDNANIHDKATIIFNCQGGPTITQPILQNQLHVTEKVLSPSTCGFSLDTGLYICTTSLLAQPNPGNQFINWVASSAGLQGITINPGNGTVGNLPENIQIVIPKSSCNNLTADEPFGTITFTDTNNPADTVKAIFKCTDTPPAPTCTPRPACLNAIPRCMIPEPLNGWCPQTITTTPVVPQNGVSSSNPFFLMFQSFLHLFQGK